MDVVKRIDACITNMQTICNMNGDARTVEAIAVHTANELAKCRDVTRKLWTALRNLQERIDRNRFDIHQDYAFFIADGDANTAIGWAEGEDYTE